jgi:Fe-Mn family superoxide dismutase
MLHKFPTLPYEFNALEPFIDEKTMRVHYEKHHKTYFENFISSIKDSGLEKESLEALFANISSHPRGIRNNGGGFYNHRLFWQIMSPNGGGLPEGILLDSIDNEFGSFENFKTEFSKVAATQFGSGWAWLCANKGGSVEVCSTANQDNPLMPGISCSGTPILGIDVWEHAYYLNYQNRRPDYINAFFNVINWEKVTSLYNDVK